MQLGCEIFGLIPFLKEIPHCCAEITETRIRMNAPRYQHDWTGGDPAELIIVLQNLLSRTGAAFDRGGRQLVQSKAVA